MARMTTDKMLEWIMEKPGVWLQFQATKSREEATTHWFKTSRKGGSVILHKGNETEEPEVLNSFLVEKRWRNYGWAVLPPQ